MSMSLPPPAHSMRRKIPALVLLLLLLAGTAAFLHFKRSLPPDFAFMAPGKLTWVECRQSVPLFSAVHCAWLTPEPGVRIAVAIIRRSILPRQFKPLLYVNGGPGAATIAMYGDFRAWIRWLEDLNIDRDLVLMDFAGTGYSEPAYTCPGMIAQMGDLLSVNLSAREEADRFYAVLADCHRQLQQQGADLSLLDLPHMVAHLRALINVLPAVHWDLYGVSYGTRIILSLLRDSPLNIGTVVLDSVYPPQISGAMTAAGLYAGSLDKLFAACRAYPDCNDRYPDLETAFYEFLHALDREPLSIVHDASDGNGQVTTVVNGYRLVSLVYLSMYSWDFLQDLPRALWSAMHGDTGPLLPMVASYRYFYEDSGFNDVVYATSDCTERSPAETAEAIRRTWDEFPELAVYMKDLWESDVCEFWSAPSLPASFHEPVRSDLPVLLLSGTFDPVTPPEQAIEARETLTNGYLQAFFGMGHGVLDSHQCAVEAVRDFLDDGRLEMDYAVMCNPEEDRPEFRFEAADGG